METPPRDKANELGTAAIRGLLGSIPLAGSVLSEVLNILHNPVEARKEKWLQSLTEVVSELKAEVGLVPSELQKNEEFVSFLYEATRVAVKNHQEEKLAALRRAVQNSAKGKTDFDESLQFLKYVDHLTVTHLRLLEALNQHAGQFGRLSKLDQVHGKMEEVLGMRLDRTYFRAILKDLENSLLIFAANCEELSEFASSQAVVSWGSSEYRPISVTPLGRSFIAFVSK